MEREIPSQVPTVSMSQLVGESLHSQLVVLSATVSCSVQGKLSSAQTFWHQNISHCGMLNTDVGLYDVTVAEKICDRRR